MWYGYGNILFMMLCEVDHVAFNPCVLEIGIRVGTKRTREVQWWKKLWGWNNNDPWALRTTDTGITRTNELYDIRTWKPLIIVAPRWMLGEPPSGYHIGNCQELERGDSQSSSHKEQLKSFVRSLPLYNFSYNTTGLPGTWRGAARE